jgi:hypothetical protein
MTRKNVKNLKLYPYRRFFPISEKTVYNALQVGYRSPRIAQTSPRNGNLSRKGKAQISEPKLL